MWKLKHLKSYYSDIAGDVRGSVRVEDAFALPIMMLLMLGSISYGVWFTAAHVTQSIEHSALNTDTFDSRLADV